MALKEFLKFWQWYLPLWLVVAIIITGWVVSYMVLVIVVPKGVAALLSLFVSLGLILIVAKIANSRGYLKGVPAESLFYIAFGVNITIFFLTLVIVSLSLENIVSKAVGGMISLLVSFGLFALLTVFEQRSGYLEGFPAYVHRVVDTRVKESEYSGIAKWMLIILLLSTAVFYVFFKSEKGWQPPLLEWRILSVTLLMGIGSVIPMLVFAEWFSKKPNIFEVVMKPKYVIFPLLLAGAAFLIGFGVFQPPIDWYIVSAAFSIFFIALVIRLAMLWRAG